MLRVGLTGGIATGKSYCLSRFAALGVPVIDADQLARDAVAPGSAGLALVRARFGPSVIRDDGTLDRPALAAIVFTDAAARADLESIVHPEVYRRIGEWFANRPSGTRIAIADIPLLYETGRHRRFDRVIVAACSPQQQLERLMARDAMTEDEARRRLAAQWPIDRKRAQADLVIDTSGNLAETMASVDRVWQWLTG